MNIAGYIGKSSYSSIVSIVRMDLIGETESYLKDSSMDNLLNFDCENSKKHFTHSKINASKVQSTE